MSSITAYSFSVLAGQTGAVRLQCGNSQIPCSIKECMLVYEVTLQLKKKNSGMMCDRVAVPFPG